MSQPEADEPDREGKQPPVNGDIPPPHSPSRTCPRCGEPIDTDFDLCWTCQIHQRPC